MSKQQVQSLKIDVDIDENILFTQTVNNSVSICIDDNYIFLDRKQCKDVVKFLNDVFDYNIDPDLFTNG